MTITNNIVAKLGVAFVAVAMLFTLAAPTANAQTNEELQEQIEALLAQIAQLQGQLGGSTSGATCSGVTFTRDLSIGSTGADVMALQKFLNADAETRVAATGAGSAGMETQYYGSLTAAAVSKFQTKYRAEVLTPLGLVNPTGYFGASSRAKANALCADGGVGSDDGDSDSDGLSGGAGSLEDADYISSINNEKVGEDQKDVEVLGLDLEADDGSDLEITAVRVEFEEQNAGGSDDLDDYAEEVTIWFDGEEVGSVDVDDMSESSGVYSRTITLDRGAIIRAGEEAELTVAVTALKNIDSADLGSSNNDWHVGVTSVRYRDALGASITESSLNDIDTLAKKNRGFYFDTFASANEVELKVSESSDNPDAGTVVVDEDGGDVETLLIGEFEAEGSDIEMDELTATITPSGASVEEIATRFILVIDGDEVDSVDADECVDTTNTCTNDDDTAAAYIFDDFEFTVEEGETVEFEIRVELNEIDGTNFAQGDSLTASVNSSQIEAEDEAGKTLPSGKLKGTANGEKQMFRSEGVAIEMTDSKVSVVSADTASESYATYTIEVEVTALGGTMYIPETSNKGATTTTGVAFEFQTSAGTPYTAGTSTDSFTRKSGGSLSGDYVRINEGQTAVFELVATLDPAAAGQYRAQLLTIGFNDTQAGPDETVSAVPSTDFRTGLEFIQN